MYATSVPEYLVLCHILVGSWYSDNSKVLKLKHSQINFTCTLTQTLCQYKAILGVHSKLKDKIQGLFKDFQGSKIAVFKYKMYR